MAEQYRTLAVPRKDIALGYCFKMKTHIDFCDPIAQAMQDIQRADALAGEECTYDISSEKSDFYGREHVLVHGGRGGQGGKEIRLWEKIRLADVGTLPEESRLTVLERPDWCTKKMLPVYRRIRPDVLEEYREQHVRSMMGIGNDVVMALRLSTDDRAWPAMESVLRKQLRMLGTCLEEHKLEIRQNTFGDLTIYAAAENVPTYARQARAAPEGPARRGR
jgi:hypothetical protein